MAMKAEDVFEMIVEKSREIPVATMPGINRMESFVLKSLRKNPIEDKYSIIKSVDFDWNRSGLENSGVFLLDDTYIDALLKLRLGNLEIRQINRTIKNTLIDMKMNIVPQDAVTRKNHEYVMPIRYFSNGCYERDDIAYLALKHRKASLYLPRLRSYEAPIISFNNPNKSIGKKIVKELYMALSEL